ncbi:ribonuclease H-like domain-containing protein [Candidatus Oleimmundimicrobium sp.]|uniref:ribonuclease H-like domain-containing protein n=1 Tax=Candidatus Oleimmundimicrobium sp. TaxID=3060597 RepID=UPI00271F81A9|nr:ribonuclease H-like domain-containing protein [Candidatus Oleimmundimicrobium sp.]MDO8886000.1 ribonuclease H-like domain-containing protein [Candidatus Oleimmundimicrobium sp.]
MKAYLDIETSSDGRITVVGMYRPSKDLKQLVLPNITSQEILDFLNDAEAIVTYNGDRFDLPVIYKHLGLDLMGCFKSLDLMYDCWEHNLYGGLKKVEKKLGIHRDLPDMNGYDAVKLWSKYETRSDRKALEVLLKYNEEDVLNLCILEELLKAKKVED